MMLLSVARMLAQQEYHVKVFGRSDDLRVRGAVCFEQMNGFIWVGTSEGLIAFDGKRATLYRVPDPDGMGSYYGRVTTMKQSDDGTIWVGTWRGLYTFDIQRERLVPSHMKGLPAKGGISAMQFAPDGLLWMIVGGQVYVVDVVKKTATLVSERQMSASCLYVSKDGAVWLGSQSGVLYRYDAHHRRMWAYDVKPASADRVSSIVSITEMGTGELALTTGNDGVYLFSPETYESRMLLTHDDTGEPILGHMAVTPDGENLWIGSEHGIIIYSLSDGRVSAVREYRGHPNSLEDDAVHSLFVDREGGVWVGTYFGGVHRVGLSRGNFSVFMLEGNNNTADVVREICRDSLGHIWVGAEDGGLYMQDPETGKLREANVAWGSYPRPFNVQSLLVVDDQLWVSTLMNGLYVVDIKSMRAVRHYMRTSENAQGVDIYGISLCRQDGTIFMASGNNVYTYDEQQDVFIPLPELSNMYSHHLYADRHGNVWVATFDRGLWKISRGKDGKWVPHMTKFSYMSVSAMIEDSNGNYWVGTAQRGLMSYNDKTGVTTQVTLSDRLMNQTVTSIVEDLKHRLWIGTFDGLYSYNLGMNLITHADRSHGLPSHYMNYSSGYFDKENGMVYIGTYKGMVRFDPSSFILSNVPLKPYFLNLYVDGQHILPADKTGILKKTLYQTKELMLSYAQNTFSISYSSPTYHNAGQVWYRYRLQPDEPWVVADGSQLLQVVNMAPGKYRLALQASYNPDVWEGETAEVEITVAPPVWLSTGAILGYVLLIVLVVVFTMTFIRRHENVKGK